MSCGSAAKNTQSLGWTDTGKRARARSATPLAQRATPSAPASTTTAASHALAKEATELAQLMNQFRIGTAQRGAASGARAQQARLAQSVAGLRASA